MNYHGVVQGGSIALDRPLPLADGTRVEVTVTPEPTVRRGSPQAVLALAGSLTAEEAEAIEQGAAQSRRIDWPLWRQQG